MRIRHRTIAGAIFRRPLMRTGRALGQFPFEAEQIGEKVVAPLRRRLRPDHFQAAANRVSTKTFTEFVLPPEALVLNLGTFWFGAHIVSGNGGAMGLAERMPA